MGDTLQELVRQLGDTAAFLKIAVDQGDSEKAKEYARQVLSLGSKVHQRVGILVEMAREARWAASVDRAVPKPRAELDGQLTIADALKEAAAKGAADARAAKEGKPRASRPRKPRKPQ